MLRCAMLSSPGAITGSRSAIVRGVYFATNGTSGGTVTVSDADGLGAPLPRVAVELAAPEVVGAWFVPLGGEGFVAGEGVHVDMDGDVSSVSVFLG